MQRLIILLLCFSLWACETSPVSKVDQGPPKSELHFMDFSGFDRDLISSLSSTLPRVDVVFFDRVTPSALPERLQHWMAAVEVGGGTVKVVPAPTSEPKTRSLLLLSVITTLWSSSQMAKDMAAKAQFKVAQAYDAEILLGADEHGNSVVRKVSFVHREKK